MSGSTLWEPGIFLYFLAVIILLFSMKGKVLNE